MANIKSIVKAVHFLFAAVTIVQVVSGLGITQYRIVEPLTLGVLTKSVSYQVHMNTVAPFLALLALHVYFALRRKSKEDKKN